MSKSFLTDFVVQSFLLSLLVLNHFCQAKERRRLCSQVIDSEYPCCQSTVTELQLSSVNYLISRHFFYFIVIFHPISFYIRSHAELTLFIFCTLV